MWKTYLIILNNTDNVTFVTDLCFANTTDIALHDLLRSPIYEPHILFRQADDVIVILAAFGECGFQEMLEAFYNYCDYRKCIQEVPQNVISNIFQIINAMFEIVEGIKEIIVEDYRGKVKYKDAYYRGAIIGGAMGKIVRETFGIERL